MLKRILLLKAWGSFDKGDVVEVDELRGARLVEEGTGMLEEEAILHGDPTAAAPAGLIDARPQRGKKKA